MSGTAAASAAASAAVGVAGGYGGHRAPFTAVQWQELEHQAMIYKYLVAGLTVPPDLVLPIRRSFDALSARFFHHPSLGYCSYYGKKFDPEPGRCRRTDGKKWRCSKDAHPDSKYCERHMHRGRNRSRKPVESQSTSQSVSTATSNISSSNTANFNAGGSGTYQNMPYYSVSSDTSFGKLQMEPLSYGIDNKEFRYMHGVTPDADDHSFSLEASANVGSLGLGSGTETGTWRLMSSQVSSTSILKQKTDSHLLGNSSSLQTFEPINTSMTQHSFLGNETLKQEQQHPVRPFFNEWPTAKESWSTLDDDDSANKNPFSTQLSISIPRPSSSFSSSGYSPKDA